MTTRRIIIPELETATPSGYSFWKQEDKMILASYYGIKDTTQIAEYLGKTVASVQAMTKTLGLKFVIIDEDREEILRKIEAGEI